MGCLLPLLCGGNRPLAEPLHHWICPSNSTFPGKYYRGIPVPKFQSSASTETGFPHFQGSTLLSEGISSGRHPAYLDYKRAAPR